VPVEASGFEAITFLEGDYAWLVPTFAGGVPGILIAVILAIQVGAGGVWLPSVRKMRREDLARERQLRAWLEARPRA
jgi:hypothetical protein